MKAEPSAFFLCGFMGVGKSTVGRLLAKKMATPFLDTDEMVAELAGASIPEIFARFGEAHFRMFEHQSLVKLRDDLSKGHQSSKCIIALGGGILNAPKNFRLVGLLGQLIYLQASEDTLLARLSESAASRPLLANQSRTERLETIRRMMKEREPIYEKAALKISTDGLTSDGVAESILAHIAEKAS